MRNIAFLVVFVVSSIAPVLEASALSPIERVRALAGKWKPAASSRHMLDKQLVAKKQTGFHISIDKSLGETHRKQSGSSSYYNAWVRDLKSRGHQVIATGNVRYGDGVEVAHVISKNDGSVYLSSGIVTGGSTRIFTGRGESGSVETLVIEWNQGSIGTPVDATRDFATVAYERDEPTSRRKPAKENTAKSASR